MEFHKDPFKPLHRTDILLRRFAAISLAILSLLSVAPRTSAVPELLDEEDATVFVDGSVDSFEFATGDAVFSNGATWILRGPEGAYMSLTRTGGPTSSAAQHWALDGTKVSGPAGWESSGNLDGKPADGTWFLSVAGYYASSDNACADCGGFRPSATLTIQGKAIHFGVGFHFYPNTAAQIWNWHETSGTWTEPSTAASMSLGHNDPLAEEPEEDPQFARFFAGHQTAPIVQACEEDFVMDADEDGVPAYRYCYADLTVHPNGQTSTEETGFFMQAGDPDDQEATWPAPVVTDGPHSLVERSSGDGIHYKLGAKFVANGITFDLIQENTVDASFLPHTFTVPAATSPTMGPDADADGLPAYVQVPMQTLTVQDDEGLSRSNGPADSMQVPVDNDDSVPVAPQGLPITQTVPMDVSLGPDDDHDGFPAYVRVEYSDVILGGGQGPVWIERNEAADQTQAIDPDDANSNVPAPDLLAPVVPVQLPAGSQSLPVSGVSTPNVPGQNIPTPPVSSPATCAAFVCTQETTLVPGTTVPVPGVDGQSSPPLPQVCAPNGLICAGPIQPQPLTPPVPGQEVPVSPVSAPALCQAAPQLCLPPTVLVPGQNVPVPGQGPMPLAPGITVAVSWSGFDGYVVPHLTEFETIGPIPITGEPVPISICNEGCLLPIAPEAHGMASVTVTVIVGSDVHTHTQPIAF